MLVSVIIPVYNRCQSIRRALTSVLAQTYLPFEIIVIDDGSTDDLPTALKAFSSNNLRLIRQSNQGVSAARNAGIRAAKGQWLAFLDSDDEWLPMKLSRQVNWAKTHPDERVIHTHEQWIRNGKKVNQGRRHQKYGGQIFLHCLPLCAMSPSSIMIHREVFECVGLFDASLPACEDYDLWLRICSRYSVHYLDEILINKYGGHADQLSQKYWGMDRFRIQALQKIIDQGALTLEYTLAAIEQLLEKAQIVMIGLEKRNKTEALLYYRQMLATYQQRKDMLINH